MQLVLDSNEYLFALGAERKLACEALLSTILDAPATYRIRLSRTILEEVRRATPLHSAFVISGASCAR